MEREGGVVGRLLGHAVLDKRIPPLWENRPEDFPLAGEVLDRRDRRSSSTRATSATARARPDTPGRSGSSRIPRSRCPTAPPADVCGQPALRHVREREREQARAAAARGVRARARRHRPTRGCCSSARSRRASTSTGGCSGSGSTARGLVREGYVDEARLWALMKACDVHVSLRSPTMGETSGTAIRALSLGKPLVVSDVGWFAELAGRRRAQGAGRRPGGGDARRRARAARVAARRAPVDGRGGARAGAPRARPRARGRALRRPRSSRRRAAAPSTTRCCATSARRRRKWGSRRDLRRRARSPRGSPRSSSVSDRLRAVPGLGLARRDRPRLVRPPGLARARDARPVHHGRRAHLLRAREELRGQPLVRSPRTSRRRGYGVVYPVSIAPAYALFDAGSGRVRGGEDDQQRW